MRLTSRENWFTLLTVEKCTGIVLSVLDFKESDQIATLFSPGGLVKIFVKRRRLPIITPLTEGEFHYVTGRGDLHRFRDGTIHQQNLRLRERYENIEAAGICVQAILKSQWPGKPAPHLYNLLRYFLHKIPEVERPLDLATIFLTKTLKHEGLLQQTESCAFCDVKPSHRFGGERVCSIHAGPKALQLTEQQEAFFMQIAEGRSLSDLLNHPIEINTQIAQLFEQAF